MKNWGEDEASRSSAPRSQLRQFAGTLAYSLAFIPSAIWFGAYKRTIVAGVTDGIVFGAITGAIFACRWPH